MTSNDILAVVTKLLLAGGGGAVAAYGVFKYVGQKSLEHWFKQREATLNADFAERLQDLKAKQDGALKHIQSEIDREIHRAKKLYDREFDVLSEAWLLLDRIWNDALETGTYGPMYEFDGYSPDQIIEILKMDAKLTDSEMKQVAESGDLEEEVRRIKNWQRWAKFVDNQRTFDTYVAANGIFMPAKVEELLTTMGRMAFSAINDFHGGIQAAQQDYAGLAKLQGDGQRLRAELKGLIYGRIWSAANPV